MSKGEPVYAPTARLRADELVQGLEPLCAAICVAGSLRRGKQEIGDVEIVAMPTNIPAFWAVVNDWVNKGRATKALYGTSYRWGEKYRGIEYEGIRFEFFLADQNNWGYQLALRTGPADANEFV